MQMPVCCVGCLMIANICTYIYLPIHQEYSYQRQQQGLSETKSTSDGQPGHLATMVNLVNQPTWSAWSTSQHGLVLSTKQVNLSYHEH